MTETLNAYKYDKISMKSNQSENNDTENLSKRIKNNKKSSQSEFADDDSIPKKVHKKEFDDTNKIKTPKIIDEQITGTNRKNKKSKDIKLNEDPLNCSFTGLENDLLIIHEKMLKMFENRRSQRLIEIKNAIDEICQENTEMPWPKKIQNEYNELCKRFIHVYFDIDRGRYLYMTEIVIDIYKKTISKCLEISFVPIKKTEIKDFDVMKVLRNVFFSAVSEFATVMMMNKMSESTHCAFCGHKINYDHIGDETVICKNKGCGAVFTSIVSDVYFKDVERININCRYRYSELTYFKECRSQWQGKENKKIPPHIYGGIQGLMNIYGIMPETLTKELTLRFIKKIDPNYKEDLELIHSKITGIKRPDISHLESKLDEMFHEFESVYDQANNSERDNFPNGYYLLFQFLRIIGYQCTKDDFFSLKGNDRLREHDMILGRASKILGGEWEKRFAPSV